MYRAMPVGHAMRTVPTGSVRWRATSPPPYRDRPVRATAGVIFRFQPQSTAHAAWTFQGGELQASLPVGHLPTDEDLGDLAHAPPPRSRCARPTAVKNKSSFRSCSGGVEFRVSLRPIYNRRRQSRGLSFQWNSLLSDRRLPPPSHRVNNLQGATHRRLAAACRRAV